MVSGLVSVIIPAYNAARSLGRAIDSVLRQTYLSVELIVVNDGSTDSTEAIARSYGDHVRYVFQENRGETAARNTGGKLANGEFVTFLDHDDYWKPQFAEKCVGFLLDHPTAVGVICGSERLSALSGSEIIPKALAKASRDWERSLMVDNLFDFWATHNPGFIGVSIVRTAVLKVAGGQREDLVQSGDLEYLAYLATFGRWGFIPQVLAVIDGTQAALATGLYRKYYNRFKKCPTVESWQQRIIPRLKECDQKAFEVVLGRVATWIVFAFMFVGDDRPAFLTARRYRRQLQGRVGRIWRLGLTGGYLTWKLLCWVVRGRTRIQYYLSERRHLRGKLAHVQASAT